MVKILFLSEAISPHISRWHDAFVDLGWEVVTASCDYDDNFEGRRLKTAAAGGPLRYLSIIEQIKAIVSEFQPHVINAHFLPTYGFAAALAHIHPLVLTLWGSDILLSGSRGWMRRLRSRFVLKRADLVVADSQSLLASAAELHSLEKTLVVSFGVRRSWYESGKERQLQDSDKVKILSCRRLEPLYDIDTLIKAAKLLVDEKFPFELTIVGSGSQEAKLRALTRELGLESSVVFAGEVSDSRLFALYRDNDIYVSTARSDSTSVSLLEAMSQKLYSVVTDIPGNREWLEDDRHFFSTGVASQLAARIKLGRDAAVRDAAYVACEPALRQKGIREDQMKIAAMTFHKLVERFQR